MKATKKSIYVLLAFLAASCARNGKQIEFSEDPKQAAKQIEALIPLGTTQIAAKRVMEQQQFTCSVAKGDFQDLKSVDYLYCDKLASGIVKRRWQVALVLADGRVSGISVSAGLVGP